MIEKTRFWRKQVLKKTVHNTLIIPEELVDRDYLTDSLLNKRLPTQAKNGSGIPAHQAVVLELEKAFRRLFGFSYVVPVSQGRLAEAILSKLLVRNGHVIPGSALFPTTRTHQLFNGATPVEVMIPEAYDPTSAHPFKGNLDLALLEKTIQTHHANWIPYICIEPCNNATGGHPISMANLRGVSEIAKKHGIPIYLDATRLIENAFLIQEREEGYWDRSIWDIVLEFCSVAQGCTLSATKDFPTPIGGFFATRDASEYHQSLDLVAGLGSGLSLDGKVKLLEGLSDREQLFFLVQRRMKLVRLLQEGLQGHHPVVEPVGGHAVYLDANRLELDIPPKFHPEKAFLYHLYETYGIRAAENSPSIRQEELGISLIRFAIPLLGEDVLSIRATVRDLIQVAQEKDRIGGLEKIGQPPGLTGSLRARFRPVTRGAWSQFVGAAR